MACKFSLFAKVAENTHNFVDSPLIACPLNEIEHKAIY